MREIYSISVIKKYSKREIIFLEADHYRGFFILLKGVVKIFKISSSGKESIIHVVKPLTTFADIPLFEGGNYPVSAEAIEECLTLFIPRDGFINLLHDNPAISVKMLAGFAKRMRFLVNQIEDLSSKEVPNRLAKYLLKEIKSTGKEKLPEPFVKLTVPKSTIAGYLGTITETLSRSFKKLQDEGIIRVAGKKVFISDLKRLKELAK